MNAHLILAIVWALGQVETGGKAPAHPGPAGETGIYAITPSVRHDRTAELIARGITPDDEAIAYAHVKWLERNLKKDMPLVTPFEIAVAYNAGITAKREGRAPARTYDYAARVAALVSDRLAHEKQ